MSSVSWTPNIIHIAYIGRLEKEKWIQDLIEMIRESTFRESIYWHIIGEGSYLWLLQTELDNDRVTIYGKLSKNELYGILKNQIDITLMPSKFLETFWLVALESIMLWVPVIGYRKWWLIPFIDPSGALDEYDPVGSFDKYIQQVLSDGIWDTISHELYTRDIWINSIQSLTEWYHKILLVHDYLAPIGWAELSVFDLKSELEQLGKTIEIFWDPVKNPSKIYRIIQGFLAPFAFWNGYRIHKKISTLRPDLIWMHWIMRNIGYFWVHTIMSSKIHTFLTHHDLWLLSPRPSLILNEYDIPKKLSIWQYIRWSKDIIEIFWRIGKYIYLVCLWKKLNDVNIHIVPSEFMRSHIEHFTKWASFTLPHSINLPPEYLSKQDK